MLLGAHVSISGGAKNAPVNGQRIGCDVIQIFSKNQMQWKAKPLDEENIRGFRDGIAEGGFGPTLIHCSYLLNCASKDDALWEKSVNGLILEVERAHALGVPFIVFHPGSPKDAGAEFGVKRVAEAVSRTIAATPDADTAILLENNAGAGNAVGRSLDELAAMLDAIAGPKERAGVCIDTCHAFVSGYPIHTHAGYDAFIAEFDEKIGLDRLKAFHLNDSKADLGSNRDRHETIGEGTMGDVPFHRLVTDARFTDTPGYIETPFETEESYKRDLAYLRDLASGKREPRPEPKAARQATLG